jgi:hypothetical protein
MVEVLSMVEKSDVCHNAMCLLDELQSEILRLADNGEEVRDILDMLLEIEDRINDIS